MKKRYQFFISSTFENLKDERELLVQSILRHGHYPAGMELFPGIDEKQYEYIKQVIDESDYYVIILGGLYGTITSDGKSYTEKEFDYAISKGKKIISMVQKDPDIKEQEDIREIKFSLFRKKVIDHGLVSFWETKADLSSKFVTNIEETIKKFPTQGWIRCNSNICQERLPFVDISSKISSLEIDVVKTIHIMASGTSSYIPIVKSLLKKNKNKNKLVNIYIYFRLGTDPKRIEYFRTQFNEWWNQLKKEYKKICFHFICVPDFNSSFSGVIINQEIGVVGFYYRENGTTLGTLENSIFINTKTDVGRYFLKYFLINFKDKKDYPTLKSCVDNNTCF